MPTAEHERVADGRNLLEKLDLIDIATWESAPEVFAAFKRGENALMTTTNNIADYSMGEGTLLFTLTPGVLFSDTRFRQRTYNGIVGAEVFILDDDMSAVQKELIRKGKSVQVPYNSLTISTEGCSDEYCFVEVNPENTDADKKLIQGFYGTTLPCNGKKVYLLRDSALERVSKAKPDGRVARTCHFGGDRHFDAYDAALINYRLSTVRGVRCANITEDNMPHIDRLFEQRIIRINFD